MKKILSFIIVAIMLMTMTVPAVSAAAVPSAAAPTAASTGTPTLYMTNSSAKAGQTLEMNVCIKDNPGIFAINIKLDFPKDVLELVDVTDGLMRVTGKNTNEASADYGTVLAESETTGVDVTGNGALFTVKFKVKDGATAQECTVGLNVKSANNAALTYVTPAAESGTAKVAEVPAVDKVFVDDGKNFNVGRLYYKNGDAAYAFTGSASDYNAHYDPETGVLTLKGYNGGSIKIGGVNKADITIELIGTNTVTGSVRNGVGGDITIIGTGSLRIDATYSGNAYGIEAGFSAGYATGNVTIKGNADVTINSLNNADTDNAFGIYAKQSITISESASVNITCKAPSNTWRGSSTCYGLFVPGSTSGGRVTIDTNGTITIDVKDAGADAYSYGVYAPDYTLTKVGNMTVEWKKTTTGGYPFYKLKSFSNATHAINIDETNCYASYRYGTPYTVTVTNGSFTGTGVKYEKNSGKFLAGDEITLTAPARYADSAETIGIPFGKWVSDDVTVANATSQSGATFTMPGKNVAVTAQYNPFTVKPSFTRDTSYSNKGSVSCTLVSDGFPSGTLKILPKNDLEAADCASSFQNTSGTSYEFMVFKNYCPAGEYVVKVEYNGTTYYSEPFTVDYSGTPAPTNPAKPTIAVSGSYTYTGSEITATITGFNSETMTVTGNVGKDAGEYTVSVFSKTGAWADGTTGAVTVKWTIAKADPAVTVPTGLTGTKGNALSTVALPSGWAWKAHETVMNATGDQSFAAVYTPADTANYNTKEANITVAVSEPPAVHPAKPTIAVSGSYTYTGSEITATITGFNSETMTVTGNVGKDAGEYTVSVVSKTGAWADGTTGAVTVKWTIAKADPAVTAPTGLTGTKGNALSTVALPSGWAWKAPSAVMNATGDQSFAAVYTPADTANYNTKEANITVAVSEPAPVIIPVDAPTAITGLIYNGSAQQGVADGTGYTLAGHKQTKAGTYTATATLTSGYKWSDGTTDPKTITWTIARKKVTPVIEVSGTYKYTGSAINPTYTVKVDDDILSADEYTASVTENINAGNGKITVSDKANGNYEIITAEKTFVIGKGTQAKPSGITGVAPKGTDTSDGKITGVTTAMEYRKEGAAEWTKVTGTEITGLSAGSYEVRFAETENLSASDAAAVTVAEHTHSFGTEWKKDGTKHWHECACGAKGDEAAHTGGTATCKEKAACSVCGEKYGDFAAHSYETVWSSDEAKHWHKCSVCGDKKDEAAHIYDNDCDTDCNVCGKTRTITHRPVFVKKVEAECEKAGNTEHYRCSCCGKLFSDAAATKEITDPAKLVIPATGHIRGDEWKSSEIYHWHECKVCGERMDTAFHRSSGEATETNPQVCDVCGYVIKEASGHTHSFTRKNTDEKYLKSAATCKASAVYYYSCECGARGTETFEYGDKLTHSFKTEWSSDGSKHWHECSLCKDKKDEADHSFEWKTDKEAAVGVAGSKHEECTVCGYKKEAVSIDPIVPATTTTTTSPAQTTTGGTSETPEKSGNAWVWIVVAVVVLGGAAVTIYFVTKKKKQV